MIISVTSLKGGVGKSTIAQNLAVCFAHNGYKVCLADADTNQSSLRWSSLRNEELPYVPAFGVPEKTLGANVKQLAKDYEIVIIDGTPSLDRVSSKIILLADLLLIPILPSGLDVWATEMFLQRYQDAQVEKETEIPAYLLLNQYQDNISFNKEVKEALSETGIALLATSLRSRIAYREVIVQGKGVIEHKDEKAKSEVMNLYLEILTKLENK
jgi:chromosome partitioning protein